MDTQDITPDWTEERALVMRHFDEGDSLTAEETARMFVWVRARMDEGVARARGQKSPAERGAAIVDLRIAMGWLMERSSDAHVLRRSAREDLGRRALACSAFRWMVGMTDIDGHLVLSVDLVTGDPNFGDGYECGALPDLDDPATQGCIEHRLLFEAWPDAGDIQVHWTREGVADFYIHDRDGEALLWSNEDVPKAEALVSALEASP